MTMMIITRLTNDTKNNNNIITLTIKVKKVKKNNLVCNHSFAVFVVSCAI